MKTVSSMTWKVLLAFGSAILVLLLAGGISYHAMLLSGESSRWVRRSHEVLEKLLDLRVDMKTIESSARGFILTGDQSYLESYREAIVRDGQDANRVRTLTVDNPGQQRRLPDLERLAARKILSAEAAFKARRSNGLEAAVAVLPRLHGQQIMD